MSVSTIPPSGLTLHGIGHNDADSKQHTKSAILLKLNDKLLEDFKEASISQTGLRLITGNTPTIRIGSRTIDLTITPEAFRHELYSASTESMSDFTFAGLVNHKAEVQTPDRKKSLGADAALALLQSQLALAQQQKEANSVSISDNLYAAPNNRFQADRQQKHAHRRGLSGSQHGSPPISASATPRMGAAPTSAPSSDLAAKTQAMRTPLVHLLAIKPLSRKDIREKTRIPKDNLEEILQRTGRQAEGKWQLPDKAYKDLDVWKFKYSSKEDRQAAIDNAIRAFDRMRVGKDDKIWDKLLPREERGKGKVLSRLHLGAGAANRNLTPYAPGPLAAHGDGASDNKAVSAANTPRLGPSASTPKGSSGKSDGAALTKRLFAKDPKKARAGEEAKEKKRKEREAAAAAAASDKEGGKPARKKQMTKTNDPKVKSAEYVHSSDDESSADGEVKQDGGISSQPKTKTPANERKPAANAAAKPKPKPVAAVSPNASDGPVKPVRPKTTTGATPRVGTPSSKPTSVAASKTSKPAALGRNTPNGLSAPSSQQRRQLSPQKSYSKPSVPSPLGAARPRVASDVSDRAAVGVRRVKQGAETPKGLGITNANGVRKRQDTVTSTESYTSSSSVKMNGESRSATEKARGKPAVDGTPTPKPSLTNGAGHKGENGVKRKAVDSPAHERENGIAGKHRKTESDSSQSQKSHSGSVGGHSSTDGLERSRSSDSSSSIINYITYKQGVTIAEKFRLYYPEYTKLYDEQAAMEKRGEKVSSKERHTLWEMHRRLEQMKREIRAASEREHIEDS